MGNTSASGWLIEGHSQKHILLPIYIDDAFSQLPPYEEDFSGPTMGLRFLIWLYLCKTAASHYACVYPKSGKFCPLSAPEKPLSLTALFLVIPFRDLRSGSHNMLRNFLTDNSFYSYNVFILKQSQTVMTAHVER
jgi:hypothetical protein